MLCCVVVSVVVECWGLFVLYGCSCVVLLCVVTCSLVMFVDVVWCDVLFGLIVVVVCRCCVSLFCSG